MNQLNLDPKERMGLLIGLGALAVVIGLALYIPSGPKLNYERAKVRLENLENDLQLARLTKMEEELRLESQQVLMDRVKGRPQNFELLTFIDRLLVDNNLKDRAQLAYFRGARASTEQPMVDLRLSNVGLQELIDFLHAMYNSNNLIAMYKLDSLRPANNRQGLDCTITLATLKL